MCGCLPVRPTPRAFADPDVPRTKRIRTTTERYAITLTWLPCRPVPLVSPPARARGTMPGGAGRLFHWREPWGSYPTGGDTDVTGA